METVALVTCIVMGLAFVEYLRVQRVVRAVRAVDQPPDMRSRHVARVSVGVGLASTVTMIVRGLAPAAALVVGVLTSVGMFLVSVGRLGIDGALLETADETARRRARRQPPPTTAHGRRLALMVGALLLALACIGGAQATRDTHHGGRVPTSDGLACA